MSHGAADGVCEPNLTPLLDLVLQILMFFVVTVRFTSEQVQEEVALPLSQAASPLSMKGAKDPIFVNLIVRANNEHIVKITGQPPMDQLTASRWIQGQYDDLKRYGEVTNAVIIRAHRDADYGKVYELLKSCSDAGFRNLKVRAMVN